jgi:hypothetical protein
VAAARKAADDERRHGAIVERLIAHFGCNPAARPTLAKRAGRSFEAFVTENVVEGCVRETFGAVSAAWQAANARDPLLKRAMTLIARDEAGHAQLAWEIHCWAMSKLDGAARERVLAERARGIATLARDVCASSSATLVRGLNVFTRHQAAAAMSILEKELWSVAA